MPEEMSAEAPPEAAATAEPEAAAAAEGERRRKRRWEALVEVVEVIVLAIVAVATSWTGYPAARWDGQQSLLSAARDNAERYVRNTVLFATVLFVVALAQRFKVRAVRVTTTVIALGLAGYTTAAMLTLPRA